METGSEIDALRKAWCKTLELSDDTLNEMLLKAMSRLLKFVAKKRYDGVIERLIRGVYDEDSSPSEKALRLFSQGKNTKRTNGMFSRVSSAALRNVLLPLDINFKQFLEEYLIECDINQAAKELPTDYVSRDTFLDTIVTSLLQHTEQSHNSLWLTSTLSGTGGVGKTVLAAATGCDPRIKSHFFNGILWLEAGDNDLGALNARSESLARHLSQLWRIPLDSHSPRENHTWDPDEHRKTGLLSLANTIADRYVLIILDDAWDGQAVAWLNECLRQCPHARLLVTSRISELAGQEANNIAIDEMAIAEARQLLLSGFTEQDELGIYAEKLLLYTGCWPLLIKLAKGFIQLAIDTAKPQLSAFKYVLNALQQSGIIALDDASSQLDIKHKNLGVVLRSSTQALANHPEVMAILGEGRWFGFSVQLQEAEQQDFKNADGLFHSLVLFPEDTHIYADMVSPLWRMDAGLANQFFNLLSRFSLVDYCAQDEQGLHIRLHDEVSRYLQQKFSGYSQPLHAKWLDVFADKAQLTLTLEDIKQKGKNDNRLPEYFWHRHGYHLIHAERWLELAQWLTTPLYLAVRSHNLSSTHTVESEVWQCLEKSFSDPTLIVFSDLLSHLHKSLPHICHWPIDFNLLDWLANLQAYLTGAFNEKQLTENVWQLHKGWEAWLLPPNNLIRTLTPHYDSVTDAIALGSDHMATCAEDNSIRIFSAINGQLTQIFQLIDDTANCLTTIGKDFCGAGTAKGDFHAWYLHDDQARYSINIDGTDAIVWCQEIREPLVALLLANGELYIVWAFAKSPPVQLAATYGEIRCCIVEKQQLWAATMSGEIVLITPETNQVQKSYTSVESISFIEIRDHLLLVGNALGQAEVWDTNTDQRVYQWQEDTFDTQWACLLPANRVVTATKEKITLINLSSLKSSSWDNYYGYFGDNLVYWSDNLVVFPTTYDTIVAFDVEEGAADHTFNPHSIPIACLNIINGQLFTACHQGNMSLWRSAPEDTRQLESSIQPAISQAIVMPGNYVLTASAQGGQIVKWDFNGSKLEIEGPEINVDGDADTLGFSSVVVFENGDVLSVIYDKRWIIWDSNSNTIRKEIQAPIDLAHYPDVHVLDGYLLATRYDEYSIILIDCFKGEIVDKYDQHKDMVNYVGKLSDGRLISASWDNSLHIWGAKNQTTSIILEGHESAVMHVIELPDGHLLSASNDGSAKVWDIDSKKAINTIQPGDFEAGEFALGRCAILNCGIYLLAGLNRMIYIYDKSWSQKAKIRMRSDIEIITACGDYQFLVGQKDGNLVMFDLMENLFNAEDEWI